ncbi:MAG: hypothetical protein CMO66_03870, partial [Verrucomicrobiales bacterium]|nr:hypothetical protein [Verrucomicrobiales bacterium]
MMKTIPVVLSGFFAAGVFAATPTPGAPGSSATKAPKQKDVKDMSPEELMQVLNRANLLARPYYNGVPDPAAVGRGYGERRKETRGDVMRRLAQINIPFVEASRFNGVNMEQAVAALSELVRNADDGRGFNFRINPYLVAGGASGAGGAPTGGAPGAGGIPGMGAGGLPLGGGGGMAPMGPGGLPQQPLGGLPAPGGGLPGAAPGGLPGGVPGVGGLPGAPPMVNQAGQPVGIAPGALPGAPMGGALPGMALPMAGGLMGGGLTTMGAGNIGEFNPARVRVKGFVSDMQNVSAMDLLNDLCLSFDHADGIWYQVMPIGIVLVERSANDVDQTTGAPLFSRVINVRPNLFGGQGLPQQGGGAGGPGGGQPGGGMMGGGMMGGGMGGMGMNPMMGGGMGGMGMNPMMG